jgi:hypothetical protein
MRNTKQADGSEELYAHDRDPNEWVNNVDLPETCQSNSTFPERKIAMGK